MASSTLGTQLDTYFFTLAETTDQHAVIASDDSLRLFDVPRLDPKITIAKCHKGVTCVTADARKQNILTAGRDGVVKSWDFRSGTATVQLREPKGAGIASISCQTDYVAAGTESISEGLGDVRVLMFDMRKPDKAVRIYEDSHTDTIADLAWHPTQHSILLSGSTDGLVSVFDVDEADEEDALKQVLNPKAAIHHIGLLADDQAYVLSTDEQFSAYGLDKTGTAEDQALPVTILGDLRPRLSCTYLIDLLHRADLTLLAHGHNIERKLSLTTIDRQTLAFGQTVELPDAHGEELVRDVKLVSDGIVLSCGEDGQIHCWRLPETAAPSADAMDLEAKTTNTGVRKAARKELKEARRMKRVAPY